MQGLDWRTEFYRFGEFFNVENVDYMQKRPGGDPGRHQNNLVGPFIDQ
jgi:hypothetical protein